MNWTSKFKLLLGFGAPFPLPGRKRYTGRVDALSVIIIYNIDPNHTVCTLHNKN